MPPGDSARPGADPDQENRLVALRGLLENTTIQTLRQAARHWGWTLKGTAKADLVEQMVGFMSDAVGMAQAIQALPSEDLAVLGWQAGLGVGNNSSKQIRAALAEGSGIRLTLKAIDEIVVNLAGRCLLFYSDYQGYRLPDLFRQWLPRPDVPKLLYAPVERLQQPAPLTVAGINERTQQLLAAVTTEQPMVTVQPKAMQHYLANRTEPIDPRRPSLVTPHTLVRWGYVTSDEQLLARFLLEQMANARLIQIVNPQKGAAMAAAASSNQAWELAAASERLQHLQRAYLTLAREGESRLNSWSEWDIVFDQEQRQSLQSSGYYSSVDQLLQQTQVVGVWLSVLLTSLPADTWIGIEPFYRLIYHVRRDLLSAASRMMYWRWVEEGEALDAQQIPFERWLRTQGRLVDAWLTGPASWLLFVQIGYAAGRPVAFRRPSVLPAGVVEPAPPGSLLFMADGAIGLDNDWRVGDLRRLLRLISVEVARDARTTLLRLDAGAFRQALYEGQTVATVSEAFRAAGFPLSPEVAEMLQMWQRRAGRYQLYEQMTVVEFGEDVLIEELRAISRLSNAVFYQPAPRCLIFPDPQIAAGLVEDLRRRGYTPQVLS